MVTKAELAKEKQFDDKYRQIELDGEIYPDDQIPRRFFLLTPDEIKRLNLLTSRRVKLYNKKYKPKNSADYE